LSRPDQADRFLSATARSRRATLAIRDEKIIAYARTGHVKVLVI
jgi:PIN domain nuclease of toxin-antitoxin system